jgi:hypothetical protein
VIIKVRLNKALYDEIMRTIEDTKYFYQNINDFAVTGMREEIRRVRKLKAVPV